MRRWKDNVNMNHTEIVCESMDWIQLSKDRAQWWAMVNTIMNLQVL
jgi:hypothetical protein